MSLIHGKGAGDVMMPIIAISGIVEEKLDDTNLPAGTKQIVGTVVPNNTIWVITHFCYYINSATVNKIEIYANGLASVLMLDWQSPPTLATWHFKEVNAWLQVNDQMALSIYNATLGDDVYFRYAGYSLGTPD